MLNLIQIVWKILYNKQDNMYKFQTRIDAKMLHIQASVFRNAELNGYILLFLQIAKKSFDFLGKL